MNEFGEHDVVENQGEQVTKTIDLDSLILKHGAHPAPRNGLSGMNVQNKVPTFGSGRLRWLCPTRCDDNCLNDFPWEAPICHEAHQPRSRRLHAVETCPATTQRPGVTAFTIEQFDGPSDG